MSCLFDHTAQFTFSDGRFVGAILDRNGLRPSRYYITHDGHMVMASEVGVHTFADEQIKLKVRHFNTGTPLFTTGIPLVNTGTPLVNTGTPLFPIEFLPLVLLLFAGTPSAWENASCWYKAWRYCWRWRVETWHCMQISRGGVAGKRNCHPIWFA